MVACAAAGVAAAVCWGECGVVGAVDVVGCPGVEGAFAFAADPAVGCGLSYESGAFGVVAFVVFAAGVADGFTFAGAGWAACG